MKALAIPVSLVALVLLGAGCTTVSLTKLDRCTVRRTTTLVSAREDVLFCDEDAPTWSNDRAVRLTQECLYQHRQLRRDALMSAVRDGQPAPEAEEDAVKECLPAGLRTVQAENDALKERVAREDVTRRQMEQRHVELENGLTRALDRPINAVADAHATSGSDATHRSEGAQQGELAKQVVVVAPNQPVAHARRVMKKAVVAEDKRPVTCPACVQSAPPESK